MIEFINLYNELEKKFKESNDKENLELLKRAMETYSKGYHQTALGMLKFIDK